MKQMWKRLVTMALALAMVLSVLPVAVGGDAALAVGAYGKTTDDGVRVRKQPSTDAAYWFKIDANVVCELLDVKVKGDVTWYKVNVEHPDPDSTRTYIGYIHGDYFKLLTEEEAADYEADGALNNPVPEATAAPTADTAPDTSTGDTAADQATAAPTQAPVTEGANTPAYAGATGQITNGGVNFRATEAGDVIRKLDRGTVVEILTIPPVIDENHWYKIRYDGDEGYVMATFLRVVSTGDPSATINPDADTSAYGFVKLILSSANLRNAPGGDVVAQWENTGEVLEIMSAPVEARGYIWYHVTYGGQNYYVREDTVQLQATSGSSGSAPTNAPVGTTIVGYVKTTAAGVNLRLKPAGEMILQVKRGVILPMLAPVTTQGGYGWYYVQTEDNIRGYLRGDCVKVCNADGSDVVIGGATSAPTQAPTTSYGYVKTIMDKVNLRTKPTGSSQEQIALGVVLPMTSNKIKSGIYEWYPVKAASGKVGYLRGDCVMVCDANGNDLNAPTATPDGATAAPTDTSAPTATPGPSVSAHGYVQITKTSVKLRKTAGGAKVGTLEKGTVWPMTGSTTTSDNYTWYPVNVNGTPGYVRGDCCFKLSATQQESYLAGNGVPEEKPEVQVNYVITTLDKVNLRAAASKDSEGKFNVPLGTVMAYKTTATVGGTMWYKVVYSNTEVWVMGSCVKVMTSTEYDQWLGSNPTNTPQTDVVAGYVRTTSSGVNLRETAGGDVITRLDKDKVFAFSKTETTKNYTWYYVKTDVGYGYLRGDCVIECNADGSNFAPSTTVPPTAGQEASYTTLKKGSTGTAVKNLVTELKNQGYYTGDITSTYTSAVEAAVRKFQTAKGLTVDGVAGEKTQHALFGTVPVGSGDSSNLSFTHYPAEKIDWFTGGIQQLWPKGANYKIYDVKTGIVWWAHRWSGGSHADIEPLTAADTARLCKIYGVEDAQDIYDKNMWERRPCLVTIGTRTFACSLDGMPHNPDGDTIADNNMTGQICLHFTNSKGHESGQVSETHQEAIEYAWNNAPGGKK